MFHYFSFTSVFKIIEKLINFINSIFFIILTIGLTFALVLSPPDYLQGETVRIMYIHVPSAWIALGCYSAIFFLTILHYIFKIKNFFIIRKSIAPIGLLFTCLAIINGSIWGKPTWGTWWAWDARLTSMIILMCFYILYIISIKFIKIDSLKDKISTFLILLGAINIPIIKYSVDWWNTLHQPASINITGTNTIHSSMIVPLALMLLVLLIYCALIFLMKYKTEIIKIKKKNLFNYD